MNELNFSGASVKCDEMSFPNINGTEIIHPDPNPSWGEYRSNNSYYPIFVHFSVIAYDDPAAHVQTFNVYILTPGPGFTIINDIVNVTERAIFGSVTLNYFFVVPPCCSYYVDTTFAGAAANYPRGSIVEFGAQCTAFTLTPG